jgi:8-hydroxy-5-deazaflavin:NADPH oxidoreductase
MAHFAVFGTGIVGRTIALRLRELGNTVSIGTRDVRSTLEKKEKDGMNNPPFSEWLNSNKQSIELVTFEEAASKSELIFNCTSGENSVSALKAAGNNLTNKILIDVANPLDFSKGFPPTLSVCNTDSLAEVIQRTFPELKVVKTLNTMTCYVMVNPSLVPGDHNVFMSGNDAEAKGKVKDVLKSFGWKDQLILDLGDITTARGTELLLPIWLRLYGKLQTPMFNFHVAVSPK